MSKSEDCLAGSPVPSPAKNSSQRWGVQGLLGVGVKNSAFVGDCPTPLRPPPVPALSQPQPLAILRCNAMEKTNWLEQKLSVGEDRGLDIQCLAKASQEHLQEVMQGGVSTFLQPLSDTISGH